MPSYLRVSGCGLRLVEWDEVGRRGARTRFGQCLLVGFARHKSDSVAGYYLSPVTSKVGDMVKIWAYAKDPQWRKRVRHAYTIRFGQDLLYVASAGALGCVFGIYYFLSSGILLAEAALSSNSDDEVLGVLYAALLPWLYALVLPLARVSAWVWRWQRGLYTWNRPAAAHYKRTPAGASAWQRVRVFISDRQSWLDLAGSVVACILGFLMGLGALAYGDFILNSPRILASFLINLTWSWEGTPLGELLSANFVPGWWLLSGYTVAIFQLVGSLVAILATPWLLRLMAWLHYTATRAVFTFDAANQKATQRVTEVESSRASSRAAQSEALRRLERNIHDGPQQQLVRLGIDVTRARKQTHSEPDSAVAILDDCAQRVQSVLTDLRDLSRGIAPPILSDRGLVAAARELAAQSAIPTVVTSEVNPGTAIPYFAEETAYFVISEALANANKHSQATSVTIHVASDGDAADSATQLTVRIIDNGCGGAHPSKGRGLAGLADRVAGAEGKLTVDSPITGPTLVKASIPCAW